ncbi:hypothetical protein [Arthrobacter methylotrophus]
MVPLVHGHVPHGAQGDKDEDDGDGRADGCLSGTTGMESPGAASAS